MNVILDPLLRKCVVVFIDNILIYSKSWEDHLLHIREVLTMLQQNHFHVKMSKMLICQATVCPAKHVQNSKRKARGNSKTAQQNHYTSSSSAGRRWWSTPTVLILSWWLRPSGFNLKNFREKTTILLVVASFWTRDVSTYIQNTVRARSWVLTLSKDASLLLVL
jgi:hypothetical protein